MINVTKDFDKIPASLLSKETNERRNEIIENKAYPTEKSINKFKCSLSNYNSKYKEKEIKEELKQIYKYKCAFCESRIEKFDVEHFRPKNIYYWLVYSWDNLLYCCSTCNENKSNRFEILNVKSEYNNETEKIHCLGKDYDIQEENKLLNPEKDDLKDRFHFKKDGTYDLEKCDLRMQYTINICKLNRKVLSEFRQELFI